MVSPALAATSMKFAIWGAELLAGVWAAVLTTAAKEIDAVSRTRTLAKEKTEGPGRRHILALDTRELLLVASSEEARP
jgi:hypothetical protein